MPGAHAVVAGRAVAGAGVHQQRKRQEQTVALSASAPSSTFIKFILSPWGTVCWIDRLLGAHGHTAGSCVMRQGGSSVAKPTYHFVHAKVPWPARYLNTHTHAPPRPLPRAGAGARAGAGPRAGAWHARQARALAHALTRALACCLKCPCHVLLGQHVAGALPLP